MFKESMHQNYHSQLVYICVAHLERYGGDVLQLLAIDGEIETDVCLACCITHPLSHLCDIL